VQLGLLLFPKSDQGWIAVKFAGRGGDIHYRDDRDYMSHPDLIGDERTHQVRTFTRRNDDA
jgi:hypothetical protein